MPPERRAFWRGWSPFVVERTLLPTSSTSPERRAFWRGWTLFAVAAFAFGVAETWSLGYVFVVLPALALSAFAHAVVPETVARCLLWVATVAAGLVFGALLWEDAASHRFRLVLFVPIMTALVLPLGRFGYALTVAGIASAPWILPWLRPFARAHLAETSLVLIAAGLLVVLWRRPYRQHAAALLPGLAVTWFVFLRASEPFGCWGPPVSTLYLTTLAHTMLPLFTLGPLLYAVISGPVTTRA
ncbi:MAG: hypothetical protein RIT81_27065 [Deltaproteobacteria bacterium]